MPSKPRILGRKTIAQSRLFHVEAIDLEFANGAQASYERLIGSGAGAVLIVPLTDENTVLLVREYAAGRDAYELALPKGRIEDAEDPLMAANRELMEETGHGARHLVHLTDFSIAPGYMTHITKVVVATDLYPKRLRGDEPEELEVVPWHLNKLDELIERNDFTEARSIAALYLTRDRLRAGRI